MATRSKNFVILVCIVSIGLKSVKDGRTDTQTPRPWLKRTKHSAIARKNQQKSPAIAVLAFKVIQGR